MRYFDQTKPCPFCGTRNFEVIEEVLGPGKAEKDTPSSTMKRVQLRCGYCGARGPETVIDAVERDESEAAAVERWNQRKVPVRVFAKGQRYNNTDWFTGGTAVYEVTQVDNNRVTFSVSRNEPDGSFSMQESFDIQKDNTGAESVLLYEYKGHENRICAEARKEVC